MSMKQKQHVSETRKQVAPAINANSASPKRESVGNSTTQLDRFREAARDVNADESDDALDWIIEKLDLRKKPEPKDKPKGE